MPPRPINSRISNSGKCRAKSAGVGGGALSPGPLPDSSPRFNRQAGQSPCGASAANTAPHWVHRFSSAIAGYPFYRIASTRYRSKTAERLQRNAAVSRRSFDGRVLPVPVAFLVVKQCLAGHATIVLLVPADGVENALAIVRAPVFVRLAGKNVVR